jgi:hypothetical protein
VYINRSRLMRAYLRRHHGIPIIVPERVLHILIPDLPFSAPF